MMLSRRLTSASTSPESDTNDMMRSTENWGARDASNSPWLGGAMSFNESIMATVTPESGDSAGARGSREGHLEERLLSQRAQMSGLCMITGAIGRKKAPASGRTSRTPSDH